MLGIVADVSRKDDTHPIAIQALGVLGGLDVLVNNASSLGPVPLVPLADTECEDLELALATNVRRPISPDEGAAGIAGRLRTGRSPPAGGERVERRRRQRLPGRGAPTARARRRSVSSSRIWNEELIGEGIRVLSVDPGDMDTPLHALAVPDADRTTLKRPEVAAWELAEVIAASAPRRHARRTPRPSRRRFDDSCARSDPARGRCEAAGRRCGWRGDSSGESRVPEPRARGRHRRSRTTRRRCRQASPAFTGRRALPWSCGSPDERRSRPTTSDDSWQLCSAPATFARRPNSDHPRPSCSRETRSSSDRCSADVVRILGHPRLIEVHFNDSVAAIWEGVARHGRPIQYAHLSEPLAIWDTWTRIAGQPVAFEPPSAGFFLDWTAIRSLRSRGARFATLTHAAGISSTGDAELDRRLPFDEPYYIPPSTAALIDTSGRRGPRDRDRHDRRPGLGACGAP